MRPTLLTALLFCGCPEQPPLVVEVAPAIIPADGVSRAVITVRSRDLVTGAAVKLTANGGALLSSTAEMIDGVATVEIIAPLERELGRRAQRTIDVLASVEISATDRLDASSTLTAGAPAEGPPILFVDANPPAAYAGSGAVIEVRVESRRVPDGSSLTISSTAGELSSASATVEAGIATVQLTAPNDPADAEVNVAVDDASGLVVVRFVADGEPLYDLDGSFAQIGTARVKLISAALTPNPQCAAAPSVIHAQFDQSGTDINGRYTTCAVTFPNVMTIVGPVTNRATQSFYDAIPVVDQDFTLDSDQLGARYAPPTSIVVVGAQLDNPESDALPTDESDPRVDDPDANGEPGVSVENSIGGEQNIVFRNIGTTKGRVISSNLIVGDQEGDLIAATETSVFGVGGAFLPDTVALGSVVEVVRIDGRFGSYNADVDNDGTITCAEVIDAVSVVASLEPPDTPFDCGDER